MNADTLRTMAGNLNEYLSRVLIETDGEPRRWADVADPWQRADVEAIAPALTKLVHANAPEPVKRRAWWERPRGHAKTADFAMLLLWVLLFSRRRRRMVWIASDAEQGLEGLDAVRTLLRHNPWMAGLLDVRADRVVNTRTESACYFTASDVQSAFGWLNVDLYCFDELVHWRSEDLWSAMFSAVGKRKHCVVLTGSNAGWDSTWQFDVRQGVADDPAWHFSALSGPVASWIGTDALREQERLLPRPAFARLWLNRWGSGAGGDAFTPEDISACVTLDGPTGREPAYNHLCGVDLAVRRDASCCCVLGVHVGHTERIEHDGTAKPCSRIDRILRDIGPTLQRPADPWDFSGDPDPFPDPFYSPPEPESVEYRTVDATRRLKLCDCKIWRPTATRKVSLDEVKAWIIRAHRRYHFRCVAMDPSQGELLAEQLRREDVPIRLVPQTGGALQQQSTALLEALRERRIDLYNHPDLVADLEAARIVERQYGWRLLHMRSTASGDRAGTPHGDSTTALSLAVAQSKRYREPAGPPIVSGPAAYLPA